MIVKALPEITGSITSAMAEPISKIGNITIVDSCDGSGGVSKVANFSVELLTKVPSMVKAVSGIDLNSLLKNAVGNVAIFAENVDSENGEKKAESDNT